MNFTENPARNGRPRYQCKKNTETVSFVSKTKMLRDQHLNWTMSMSYSSYFNDVRLVFNVRWWRVVSLLVWPSYQLKYRYTTIKLRDYFILNKLSNKWRKSSTHCLLLLSVRVVTYKNRPDLQSFLQISNHFHWLFNEP